MRVYSVRNMNSMYFILNLFPKKKEKDEIEKR